MVGVISLLCGYFTLPNTALASNCSKAEGPSKCINKACVTPSRPLEVPSDFLRTENGDLYFVSQEELPWAQAQYECISRKGFLAEINGKLLTTKTRDICHTNCHLFSSKNYAKSSLVSYLNNMHSATL